MKNKIIVILIFLCSSLIAQSAGKTGLSFLNIGNSAKNLSLSNIGLLNDDISSITYNPATVNFQKTSSILFTHQMWIQDMSSDILNASFSLWGLPLAFGVNTTKINDFEIRTMPSENPEALFNINYFYGSFSTGFKIIENLTFGFSIKYLYESMLSDDASGTGYDLGFVYSDLLENLNLGLSVRNLGSMNKLRNKSTKLPSDLIFNATYLYHFDNVRLLFLPVFGIQKYFESDNLNFHFGTEIKYDKQFALRLGYLTGYESRGLSVGAGFYWNGINIDYAFTPFSYSIGNANTISIGYTF
ncbi:MAG: hypothetical protein CR986_07490 [Ignavibacteriae bacterium]|nr:MAG: hypothetical protein CR986_07490 [Ignavibacteriota bacterium]